MNVSRVHILEWLLLWDAPPIECFAQLAAAVDDHVLKPDKCEHAWVLPGDLFPASNPRLEGGENCSQRDTAADVRQKYHAFAI